MASPRVTKIELKKIEEGCGGLGGEKSRSVVKGGPILPAAIFLAEKRPGEEFPSIGGEQKGASHEKFPRSTFLEAKGAFLRRLLYLEL